MESPLTPVLKTSFLSKLSKFSSRKTRFIALLAVVLLGVAAISSSTSARSAGWRLVNKAIAAISESVKSKPTRKPFNESSISRHTIKPALPLGTALSSGPTVSTDKTDYTPGSLVLISGSGFGSGETVTLQVTHSDDTEEGGAGHEPWTVIADLNGSFTTTWFVHPDDSVSSSFLLSAIGGSTGLRAETTFTDSAADLVQCHNGPLASPTQCAGDQWKSGNAISSSSHYVEGGFIPYRLKLTALTTGTHTVTIKWDTTKAGSHAIDYLGTFNLTETNADPCSEKVGGSAQAITGCSYTAAGPYTPAFNSLTGLGGIGPGTFTQLPVNVDPNITSDPNWLASHGASDPSKGAFTLFGGTLVSQGAYTLDAPYAGDSSTRTTITFTTTQATVVLAWSGHISTRIDWGLLNSAVNIPGSPYHTSMVDLDGGSVGSQDQQLNADAVIFPGSITVVKQANPEGSTSFPFTTTSNPSGLIPTSFGLVDNGSPSNTTTFSNILVTGTSASFGITENTPAGWDLGAFGCVIASNSNGGSTSASGATASITMKEGENWTCTFNNTQQPSHLIIIKHVINDNGGTAVASDFTLDSGGAGDSPDNFAGAESPGTNVTLDPGAYAVTESGPTGYTQSFSADCSGTIAAGQTKTCTVTNDDQAAHLIVIKHVINDNGGTATAANFTLDSGGANDTPDNFAGAESPGTSVTLNAGAYAVTESGPSGYTRSDSADCSGSISLGETKTCTVTNDDQAAHLIVIKHVVNDNGGTATAASFTLDSGGAGDSPDNFAGAESPGTDVTLDAGAYAVTESGPTGYTQSNSADCSGTIANGQTKTCTVTNDDQAAHLIVIKHVINDNGGTATAANFTLDSGGANDTPDNFAGAESPGTSVTLNAGAYAVTESGPSGYTRSDSADCSGSISLGETKTCTVTNDDQAAHLIVIKHVINDNGGTATAASFTLDSGGAGDSPDNFAGAESPGTDVTLDAGSYSVSETGPSGYTQSNSTDCSGTIANGQTKTCTVTNDDQAAHLIVIKHVINDNGGTATAANFTLDSGGAGDSPDNFAGAESPGINVTLDAGAYAVTESGPSGYTRSDSADCSGTIANGQTKTCTVTNDDIAPKLIVIKHVVNNSGGTSAAGDFSMTVDDPGTNPASFPGAEAPGTEVTVDPGAYSVSETGPSGYAASYSADCSGSLAIGETKTCTVTNDDVAPKLIVIKHVVNNSGGTSAASDFSMTVDDPGTNPASFPGAEAPGTEVTVDPGAYSVSETGPSGYAASYSAGCSGSLAIGETKTCTVTNDDIAPKLIVIKHVVNNSGGTSAASAFSMTVDDPGTNPASFPGAEAPGTEVTVDPGAYSVGETGPSGYAASYSADCSGSLAIGETKTCTVTNDDIAPKLIVIKHVVNDNGGTSAASAFSMTVDDPGTNPASFPGAESPGTDVTVDPGAYSVSETGPSGYAASYSADCSGSLAIGETKTCTVTNDDVAPKLIVIKHVVNNSGGTSAASDFSMTVDDPGTNPASFPGAEAPGTEVTVDPGAYSVSETGPSGYAASYSADCSGSLAIGETKTCTVTNDDIAPKLIVIKHVVNNSGGTSAAGDFSMTVDDPGTNPASFPGAEAPGTEVTVDPGAYSVSETGPSGYAASYSADCSGSLAIGETKTCTVTNDDIAPKLIVIKHVVNDNGGTSAASAFSMTVDDPGTNPASFPGAESPGTNVTVDPGAYSVSETGPSGYGASYSAGCSGSLAIGETKTCTVTNNDIAPSLTLNKITSYTHGGTAPESSWTLTAYGGSAGTLSGPGAAGSTDVVSSATFKAGTYALSESAAPWGYSNGAYSCVKNGAQPVSAISITLAVGDTAVCSITNTDLPGTIVVQKIIKPTGASTSFNFDANGTGYSDFALAAGGTNSQTLNAGSYSVMELVPLGWVLTGIGGSTDANTPYNCTVSGSGGSTGVGDLNTQTATINLKLGDTVTCVFENTGSGQGVTRTQGFWATHTPLANIAWFGGTAFGHTFPGVGGVSGIGNRTFCTPTTKDISTLGMLMGGFWSDISKTSTGGKRSATDQARMQLLQQLLAAELNASAFGSAPSSGSFAAWESAYCSGNQNDIKNAQQQAASFNTFGDSSTFTPGTSADSKNARAVADYAFWNILP